MPAVAIHDLQVKDDDLVVGTNGRSAWILDDITPLREWTPKIAEKNLHLFMPRATVRWSLHGEVSAHMERMAQSDNPPEGAIINYSLKAEPKKPLRIEITNAAGIKVAQFASDEATPKPDESLPDGPDLAAERPEVPTKVGVNRFVWNLKHEGAKIIDKAKVDWGEPTVGPLVAPGLYRVRISVDNQSETAVLRIDPDPRTLPSRTMESVGVETLPMPHVTADDLEAFQLRIRDDVTQVSQMVTAIRQLQKQLTLQRELLADEEGPSALQFRVKCSGLSERLEALEAKLHNPRARVSYDILAQVGGAKLYSQLVSMMEFMRDGDTLPAQGMIDLLGEYEAELKRYASEWEQLQEKELAAVNELAKKRGYPTLWVPKGKK